MAKNISTSVFIIIISLFLLNSSSIFAQNYPLTDLNDLINSPENYKQVLESNELEEIQNLIYELNSTVLISNSGVRKFGDEAPVTAETNPGSFNALKAANPDFRSVKLLKIKIQDPGDLNRTLDLSSLKNFEDLKYVYVQCAIDCNLNQIQNMFSNTGDIKIFYIIAIPR